jgi:NADPH-dependent FMN reductase
MSREKLVIVDGAGAADQDLAPIRQVLSQVLASNGAEVQIFPLREMKVAHCLGCFNCWIKTPGMCVEADAGREIAKALIRSDTAVLFTPVTFGGYSPELKKMVDHFIQLISPFFGMNHGEVHHQPRYARRPRLMVVGVQRKPNPDEARIFKTLAGRNAINLLPASFAVEVVCSAESADMLRRRFESLLNRSDALPFGDAAASVMPGPVLPDATIAPGEARRALLIVGSPKTNEPSTSGALGNFLLDQLAKLGWETESLTLRGSLHRAEAQSELLSAADRASLVILAFPLYVDALPYLPTRALTMIAAHRQTARDPAQQRFVAIVNSGFPETHQNAVALAICREFASQCGMSWAGGLAFAAGGTIGGQPLTDAKRNGPPVRYVIAALDMTAKALDKGLPVPAEAGKLIAKHHIPAALWNRLYLFMASDSFRKLAEKNGISKETLLAQPYAV